MEASDVFVDLCMIWLVKQWRVDLVLQGALTLSHVGFHLFGCKEVPQDFTDYINSVHW